MRLSAGVILVEGFPGAQRHRHGLWQECQPHKFMFNLRLRPLRMFLLDPRFGKCTREQTHFQCQDEALFFRHCPMKLDSLSFRARIGDGHEQNVNTERCLSASSDSPDDEKRFLVRRWLLRMRDRLSKDICHADQVVAIREQGDELMLAATIADVIIQSKLHINVPISILSAQFASLGVKWICGSEEE